MVSSSNSHLKAWLKWDVHSRLCLTAWHVGVYLESAGFEHLALLRGADLHGLALRASGSLAGPCPHFRVWQAAKKLWKVVVCWARLTLWRSLELRADL